MSNDEIDKRALMYRVEDEDEFNAGGSDDATDKAVQATLDAQKKISDGAKSALKMGRTGLLKGAALAKEKISDAKQAASDAAAKRREAAKPKAEQAELAASYVEEDEPVIAATTPKAPINKKILWIAVASVGVMLSTGAGVFYTMHLKTPTTQSSAAVEPVTVKPVVTVDVPKITAAPIPVVAQVQQQEEVTTAPVATVEPKPTPKPIEPAKPVKKAAAAAKPAKKPKVPQPKQQTWQDKANEDLDKWAKQF